MLAVNPVNTPQLVNMQHTRWRLQQGIAGL